MLRELSDIFAKSFSVIFERVIEKKRVLNDYERQNNMSMYTKDKKEDPGNCRPVNLASVTGKTKEQNIILNT